MVLKYFNNFLVISGSFGRSSVFSEGFRVDSEVFYEDFKRYQLGFLSFIGFKKFLTGFREFLGKLHCGSKRVLEDFRWIS